MSVLDKILSAGGGGVVEQLAGQFGIHADQAGSAISGLLPALAGGLKEKLSSGTGSALSSLISSGSLSKFADDPANLASPEALTQGNSLLKQIFGGGDLSTIATSVAQKAGISSSVITAMLPIAATLLGGLLSKSTGAGHGSLTDIVGAIADAGHGGLMGSLKSFASKVLG